MVVDDELDLVQLLKLTLESKGFRVNIFTDANIALEHFRNKVSSLRPHPYDLLVLDIKMPKMDGFELYNEIKKHDSAVKVCFMTALAGLNEYAESLTYITTNQWGIEQSSNEKTERGRVRIVEVYIPAHSILKNAKIYFNCDSFFVSSICYGISSRQCSSTTELRHN